VDADRHAVRLGGGQNSVVLVEIASPPVGQFEMTTALNPRAVAFAQGLDGVGPHQWMELRSADQASPIGSGELPQGSV